MPTTDSFPIGAPCWVDLMTSDTRRSSTFYSELFGWTAEEANEQFGGYFNFRKNGVRVAGCMPRQGDNPMPDAWSVYLTTDDAVKTLESAEAHGAQIIAPAMQVADLGTMGVLADPGGAAIGLWQPGTHKGSGIVAETGAPSWFELHTRDYAKAISFYRDVFFWDTEVASDTPEFRYTVAKDGDRWLAGVADATDFLPEGVPAYWAVYFGVDDTDAALDKTLELGGSIQRGAEDTPYGRLATAVDPTGAVFRLVAPNDQMPARNSAG
jgi:predicted enzyme related to lactoylglutathione lyase